MSSSFRCFALLAFLLILLLAPGCKHREIRSWAPDLRDLDWLAEHDYRPDRYRGKSLAHVRDDYTAGSWRRRSEQEGVRSGEPPAAGAGQVAGEPGPGARELTDKRKEFIRWLWVRGPDFVYNAFKLRAREEPSRDPQLAQSTLLERHHILKELEETSLANAQRLLFQYRSEFEEIDRSRETVRRREAARRKAGKGQQYSSGVSGGSEERIQTPNLFAKRCGLALSGGGIRSASFATGVLLGLHEIGLLNEFGYLSTVSGGGYAGAWYMLQGNPDELLTPGSQHLHHLAQSGNYLVSVHASDSFGELALKAGTHFGLMPVHWLVNGLFDLDLNVPIARTSYRWGIEQAFLYDESKMFAREEGRKDYGSMAFFSPVTRTRHPFWIINMHVALSDETTPVHRNRTGDAFEVTCSPTTPAPSPAPRPTPSASRRGRG
jgi:hypothetical protein